MRIEEVFDDLGRDFLSLLIQTFDQIDDLVFVMSYNGTDYEYVYANRAARQTINLPKELNHVTLRSLVSPQAYCLLEQKYDLARRTMKKVRFKAPVEHSQKPRIGESLLTPIYMKEHDLYFTLAIVRDITEQEVTMQELKAAQQQIDEEKYRLESLMHYNNEAIFQLNSDGKIIKCNPEAKLFLESESSQILNSQIIDWFNERFFESFFYSNATTETGSSHHLWLTRTDSSNSQYLKIKFVPIFIQEEQQGCYLLIRDTTAEFTMQKELQRMAFNDHLSGLPNRRAFDDRLDYVMHMIDGTQEKVALFLIDGHKFKDINDTYGHDAGDAVIKETAERLQRVLRDGDLVARFGGDEFAIILPYITHISQIEEVAKRILSAFEKPFYYKKHQILIQLGMGGSYFPGTALNKNQLIKEADHALYEIKESSRTGYKLYQE